MVEEKLSIWRWLTSAAYRKERELVPPLLFAWRCLWFLPIASAIILAGLLVLISYGPSYAKDFVENNRQ